jgi:Fe-S-cluster-containing hydrogenase component 2
LSLQRRIDWKIGNKKVSHEKFEREGDGATNFLFCRVINFITVKMNSIIVNKDYCPQNHPCPLVRVCPAGAITQRSVYSAPDVDYSKCTNCGKCTRYCGYGVFSKISS